ncbi:unnamed protein product [Linum tenue]|uniref:RING-type E3 ubiquitin transferase n=1 Tax=Linum tenue TaxID=586396 RepID=A0AAV0S5H5_9ROSI|nr:unnamed protein product [Linum tenue]
MLRLCRQIQHFQLNWNLKTMSSKSLAGEEAATRRRRPAAIEADEKVYVAVGKVVKESKSVLTWTLQNNSAGKKICIILVHQPSNKLPLFGGIQEAETRKRHEKERSAAHKILDDYISICQKMGFRAEKLMVENDSIAKGILEIISSYGVRNLVMGAASDSRYSRNMMEVKSRKAISVRGQIISILKLGFPILSAVESFCSVCRSLCAGCEFIVVQLLSLGFVHPFDQEQTGEKHRKRRGIGNCIFSHKMSNVDEGVSSELNDENQQRKEKIYLPICEHEHWYLAIVNMEIKEVYLLDSYALKDDSPRKEKIRQILSVLDEMLHHDNFEAKSEETIPLLKTTQSKLHHLL